MSIELILWTILAEALILLSSRAIIGTMVTHLKNRKYYEDQYDRITVQIGWDQSRFLVNARNNLLESGKLSKEDKQKLDFWITRLYWWCCEVPVLLPRYDKREATINGWMADDRAADQRLEQTRPTFDPACEHCGKYGLRLNLKNLLPHEGEQTILFMFDCPSCKKRSAYWENGKRWISPKYPCEQCQENMDMKVTARGKLLTTTYTCPHCRHKVVEKQQLGTRTEQKDGPDYEKLKEIFCLSDDRAKIVRDVKYKWENLQRMLDEEKIKEEKKEIYDVAAAVNMLKIVDVMEILKPAIEKASYIELRFEPPTSRTEFYVTFSCLDKNTARSDYESKSALKKTVVKALADTNWRLMSEGIYYRLGYLSGRVRAYEDEEALVELLEREAKRSPKKSKVQS